MGVIRFSDIKVRHIYNVIFDTVRQHEFNGKHLALVLKKNNDKHTSVVMPLTTEPRGIGVNKLKLGTIESLPTSIKNNDTYAVFNQIRTVNANRFISLKEADDVIECKVEDDIYFRLLDAGISDMLFHCTSKERLDLFKSMYYKECITRAKDLAYSVIKISKSPSGNESEVRNVEREITNVLKDVPTKLIEEIIQDDAVLQIVQKLR